MALGWYNVKDYGATGNGSTDDTTAVNAAIAALITHGRGVLYFPAGTYLCTAALTALSVPCMVLGDGSASLDGVAASSVTCSSGTAVLFTVTSPGVSFQDIDLTHTGSAATAGAGVSVQLTGDGANHGSRNSFENVSIESFYDNWDIAADALFTIHNFNCVAPVRYGIHLRNTVNQDAGDGSISAGVLTAYSGAYNIYYEGGGGLRISDIKINGNDTGYGIWMRPAGGTSISMVRGCSIENVTGNGIDITANGQTWRYILLSDLHFGLYSNTTGHAISIDGTGGTLAHVVISGIVGRNGTSSGAMVAVTDVDDITVVGFASDGFGSKVSLTSCTNVTNLV